jgi:Fe-S cluster biogenesis protein NfuA/rhodanese-related sulfurtransferase
MFGGWKEQIQKLEGRVEELSTQLRNQKAEYEAKLKTLRQQTASMASGVMPTPQSILSGLPYSEIPKEQVESFIKSVPNLLILDVRSDEGWNNGHIPEAKHVSANQVFQRLDELSDKSRPILTICANGNTAVSVCQLLAREGYQNIFNALGGMAGYRGEVVRPHLEASDVTAVRGTDRKLITKVLQVIDRDVRPGLKRDGGDLKVVSVENGTVQVKMVGACVGCGAQKRTVEDGIKNHLKQLIPEIQEVEDLSLGIPQ